MKCLFKDTKFDTNDLRHGASTFYECVVAEGTALDLAAETITGDHINGKSNKDVEGVNFIGKIESSLDYFRRLHIFFQTLNILQLMVAI